MPDAQHDDATAREETLAARLRRQGRVGPPEAEVLARAVGEALGALHANGVVHGELCSESVVCGPSGDVRVELPEAGRPALESLDYRSPEQVSGRAVDARADLWALGVVLFEALTGALPFEGSSPEALRAAIERKPARAPSSLVPSLGARVDAFFARALKKDAVDRHPTVAALVDAFVVALQAPVEPPTAPPPAPKPSAPPSAPATAPTPMPELSTAAARVAGPSLGLLALFAAVALGAGLYVLRIELDEAERENRSGDGQPGEGFSPPSASVVPSVRLPAKDGDRTLPLERVHIMNVWLERCGDCMPSFEAWKRYVREERLPDLPVVNVSAYHAADPAWAEAYAVDQNLVTDAGGAIVRPLGVGRFTTFVVGPTGDILFRGDPKDPGYLECLAKVAKPTER